MQHAGIEIIRVKNITQYTEDDSTDSDSTDSDSDDQ